MIKENLYSIKHTDIERVFIRAKEGAEISTCIREAGLTAFAMGVDVELTHNGKIYLVNLKHLVSTIKEQA